MLPALKPEASKGDVTTDLAFNSHPESQGAARTTLRQLNSTSVLPNLVTYLGPCSQGESLSFHFQRSISQATNTRKNITEGFLSTTNPKPNLDSRSLEKDYHVAALGNDKSEMVIKAWTEMVIKAPLAKAGGRRSSDCLVVIQEEQLEPRTHPRWDSRGTCETVVETSVPLLGSHAQVNCSSTGLCWVPDWHPCFLFLLQSLRHLLASSSPAAVSN